MDREVNDRADAAQIRGARAMLGWSMADLARASEVSVSTVKRIEDQSYGVVADDTRLVVQRTLEQAGVTFLPEDDAGIGLRVTRRACGPRSREEGDPG